MRSDDHHSFPRNPTWWFSTRPSRTRRGRDAFGVLEDKRPQPIRFFLSQDAPVVGLLLDGSGSMQPNRQSAIAAATAFAETSNPQDEMFALGFNDDVSSMLPRTAPFTGDANTLRHALANTIAMRGRTALYDALVAGLDYLARGTHERKILVVVSDSGDNASRATASEILRRTQASNLVVHTAGLLDELEREANPKILKQLAGATGGAASNRTMREMSRTCYVISHATLGTATRSATYRRTRTTTARSAASA